MPLSSQLVKLADRQIHRYRKPIVFLLVGLLNTTVGYGLFALIFLLTGFHQFALIIATICGVFFNYFSTGRLVFNSRNSKALFPFVLGYSVILAINFLLLETLVRANVSPLMAQVMCLPIVVFLTYFIVSRWVFKS